MLKRIQTKEHQLGCVDIKDEIVKIESKSLFFSAYCVQANNPIKFVLNLTLFEEIVPESSHWKLESVGKPQFLPSRSEDYFLLPL